MERLVLDKVVDKQSRDEVRSQFRAAEAAKAEADAKIQAAAAQQECFACHPTARVQGAGRIDIGAEGS